jgi:hypothetical protein
MWWLGPIDAAVGASVVAVLIVFTHRGNLRRLWSGSERTLET